jgi:ATP-binding cassette subfamily C protein
VETGGALFGASSAGDVIRLLACPAPDARLQLASPEDAWALASHWIAALCAAAGADDIWNIESPEQFSILYSRILDRLAQRITNENEKELERLHASAELSKRRMHESLAGLVSAGRARETAGPSHSSALACAVNMVADALGAKAEMGGPAAAGSDLTISSLAHRAGMRVRGVSLSGEWWREDGGPLLGFREGKPVALIPRAAGTYCSIEPTTGVATDVGAAVAASIERGAYVLYRPLPDGAVTAASLLRFCLNGCGRDILRLIATAIVIGALGLVLPLATAFLFDTVVPDSDHPQLWILAGVLAVNSICCGFFTFAGNVALRRIESRAGATLQLAIWDRMLRLPARFFREFNSTDLALRSLGVEQIRRILAGPALSTAMSSMLATLQIAMLIRFGGMLAIPALAMVAFAVVASLTAGVWQVRRQRTLAEIKSKVSATVMQLLSGIAKIRAAGAESRAFALWARGYRDHRAAAQRSRNVDNCMSVLNAALPIAGITVLFFSAAEFIGPKEGSGLGAFLAFSTAFQQLLAGAVQFGSSAVALAGVIPLLERIRPILDTKTEITRGAADPGALAGRVEASRLTFRYHPAGPAVLTDISFTAKAGEFVAFVGASGSGKSTLLRLLLGFETPETGAIRYDGSELSLLDVDAVRRQIGAVLQDGRLLPGNLATNILGSSGLGMEAAWNAARAAGLAADIEAMPLGMQTLLSESSGFSGGQRQRLLIARALVAKPRILILDEATSALDNRTQGEVMRAIDELQATRIVVAHRVSTIRNADRIYVLENGSIVESGKFDELMESGGWFARLARRQIV